MFSILIKVMMKNKFNYAFLLVSFFLITACKNDPIVEEPIIEDPIVEVSLDKVNIHFSASLGTDTIKVRGSRTVNVGIIDEIWLEAKVVDNIVIVKVSPNLISENREAVIRISTGEEAVHSVPVVQEGSIFEVESNHTIELGGQGNNQTIPVINTAEVPYSVEIPEDNQGWLSYDLEGNFLILKTTPSDVLFRESSISLILGERRIELLVKQTITIEGNYILAYDNSYPDNKKNDDGTLICLPYQRKVTLKKGEESNTYVINENLPTYVTSLTFTYENEKLSMKAGQKVGKTTTGAELVVKLFDTSKMYFVNDDELSYVAPLAIREGCVNFTFENTPYSAEEVNYSCDAMALRTNTQLNVHLMKNIRLLTDTGELTEIKEIDPPPVGPRVQNH
ncbi:hypothetical protein EZS27_026946 [termite gut metagenome]|uniref:BACON domain-containing protein n=1 Tax=termite gut metagenome TaxID=433724 RepID=A0A5J4QST4_9ZZZZ